MNKKIIASILCAGMILTMGGMSLAEQDQPQTNEEQTQQEQTQQEQNKQEQPQVAAPKAQRYEVLVLGDSDQGNEAYIKDLQKWLKKYGHFDEEPTGFYGEKTQNAVIDFQTKHGMSVDGKAGPITRKILMGPEYTSIPQGRTVINANGTGIDEFSTGDRGAEMTKIQTRLKELGYYTYDSVTDFYGPITEEAVVDFKKGNSLDASNSTIDLQTYNTLFSSNAKSKSQAQAATQATQQKTTAKATTTTTQKKTTTKKKATTANKGTSTSAPRDVSNSSGVEAVIGAAQAKTGSRYSYGATGPNTFDCSGLLVYSLRAAGVSSPRTAAAQSANGAWQNVSYNQLKRGDLVFFYDYGSTSGGIGHAGIYLGGGQFIHASSGNAYSVTVSSLSSGGYRSRFANGRRVF